MNREEVKVGDLVKAVFLKHGEHLVIGEIFEIATNERGLKGTWVSIKITGGDESDKQVA